MTKEKSSVLDKFRNISVPKIGTKEAQDALQNLEVSESDLQKQADRVNREYLALCDMSDDEFEELLISQENRVKEIKQEIIDEYKRTGRVGSVNHDGGIIGYLKEIGAVEE